MIGNDPSSCIRAASFEKSDGAIRLAFDGRDWLMRRPADLEALWDNLSEEQFTEDERLPYWVEIWPAALGLARWLTNQRERLSGRVCLDLGCGLGFTALTASLFGAKVIGADYEAEALSYAAENALVNAVPSPLWLVMDWRFPAVAAQSCPFIWAADVLYEKRFALPVLDFLSHALSPDGVVWLSDPGRNTFASFQALAIRQGWRTRKAEVLAVMPLYSSSTSVSVNIWELQRA